MCELHALFVAACICLAFGFLEEFDAVGCRVYGLESKMRMCGFFGDGFPAPPAGRPIAFFV